MCGERVGTDWAGVNLGISNGWYLIKDMVA